MSDFKPGDIVHGDLGGFFLVEGNRYNADLTYVPLLAIGASQPNPPAGAQLVRRTVDGKRLLALDLLAAKDAET